MRMSQSADTETVAIGAGVDPGDPAKVAFGSITWAICTAIRAEKAKEDCPTRAKVRRELVHAFDIAKGKNICTDFITDCFEEDAQTVPVTENIGSLPWVVELIVRHLLDNELDPIKAAPRREAVRRYEVLQGRDDVDDDLITDCFTNATTGISGGGGGLGAVHREPRLRVPGIPELLEPPGNLSRPPSARFSHVSNQPSSTRIDEQSVCQTITRRFSRACLTDFRGLACH